jgi:hypothetical protein
LINLIFSFSGRTSRREIRKLLSECLFWRIKRAKAGRHGSKIHAHAFLFDDDDEDTERSIATTAATPYCALTIHSQNRPSYLSQQSSHNNYPIHLARKSTFFTCCGFTIDLSRKHSIYSSNGDITSRRPTICKSPGNATTTNNHNTNNNNNNNSPKKYRNYSHSPVLLSSSDRSLQQQTACLKSNDDDDDNNNNNQSTTPPRATTVVHCFRHMPSSTVTSIGNHTLRFNTDPPFTRRSIAEDKGSSSVETLPYNTIDAPTTTITITDVDNPNINSIKGITDAIVVVQNHLEEQPLPAYIIETC